MARKLSDENWADIRRRYSMGEDERAIARDYNIPHGTIQYRRNKENWSKELASKVSDLKGNIREISQLAKTEDAPAIAQAIKDVVSDTLDEEFELEEMRKSLRNIDKGGLNAHSLILQSTIKKIKTGIFSEAEASKILGSQGINLTNIGARLGVGTAAIEINNNQQNNTQINVDFPDDPIAASRAYQEFMENK